MYMVNFCWRPGVITSRDSGSIDRFPSENAARQKLAEIRRSLPPWLRSAVVRRHEKSWPL